MRNIQFALGGLALCAGILLCACGGNGPPSRDPVTSVPADDELMDRAIAEARQTVDEFVRALQNPGDGEWGFAVKVPIEDRGQVEHFWLNDVSYAQGLFTGTINNDPQTVQNVRLGQRYSVKKTEISDWMYMKGKKMIGNRTLQALFPHMPPEEVKQLKRQFEWE